jgi:hypothetical protein
MAIAGTNIVIVAATPMMVFQFIGLDFGFYTKLTFWDFSTWLM